MQIKNISRIRFPSGRTPQYQGDLPVSYGLFRKIIVYDQSMSSAIPEILSDSSSGEWGVVTHGGRIRSIGSNDDTIFQGTFFTQGIHQSSHRRSFLSDSDINAVHRIPIRKIRFLIENRIYGNGCLSRLPVSDNQFPLSSSDRNHRIDSFNTRLQRFFYRLTENHPRRFPVQRQLDCIPGNRAGTVNRISQSIHNPSQQPISDTY